LFLLNGLADLWSSILRRRLGTETKCGGRCVDYEAIQATRKGGHPVNQDQLIKYSIIAAALLVPLSFWYVNPDFGKLISERTIQNAVIFSASAFPPSFGVISFAEWVDLAKLTIAMSPFVPSRKQLPIAKWNLQLWSWEYQQQVRISRASDLG
jgi:hypothetical protein